MSWMYKDDRVVTESLCMKKGLLDYIRDHDGM